MWFLSFFLFMWCITFIDLWMLYWPCIPGINAIWSRCVIFLRYGRIGFASILLRILPSVLISDVGLYFPFFVVSLSGFGIRIMLALWSELGSLPSSWILWNSLRRRAVSSSWNAWWNSPCSVRSRLFFAGSVLIILFPFHWVSSVYSDSLILPDVVLQDYMSLGIYPFCPGCPVCWLLIVHNIFLQSFVFLWCQLLFLLFHFWFYLFGFSLFLVGSG